MSLRDFIRRSTALTQYRQLLCEARRTQASDPTLAADARTLIRSEFRIHRDEQRPATVAVLLGEGNERLEWLRNLAEGRGQAGDRAARVLPGQRAPLPGADTWLGSADSDGKDERGRVGEAWPWGSPQ